MAASPLSVATAGERRRSSSGGDGAAAQLATDNAPATEKSQKVPFAARNSSSLSGAIRTRPDRSALDGASGPSGIRGHLPERDHPQAGFWPRMNCNACCEKNAFGGRLAPPVKPCPQRLLRRARRRRRVTKCDPSRRRVDPRALSER